MRTTLTVPEILPEDMKKRTQSHHQYRFTTHHHHLKNLDCLLKLQSMQQMTQIQIVFWLMKKKQVNTSMQVNLKMNRNGSALNRAIQTGRKMNGSKDRQTSFPMLGLQLVVFLVYEQQKSTTNPFQCSQTSLQFTMERIKD